MRRENYYELLGVSRYAPAETIREAYRELARIYHPDSQYYSDIAPDRPSGEQAERFRRITEAYTVLSNPERREQYDESLPPDLPDWEEPSDAHTPSRFRNTIPAHDSKSSRFQFGHRTRSVREIIETRQRRPLRIALGAAVIAPYLLLVGLALLVFAY